MATHRPWLLQSYCKHSRFAPALHLPLFVGPKSVICLTAVLVAIVGLGKYLPTNTWKSSCSHKVCTAAPYTAVDTRFMIFQ